jgi:hypothetical protein
MTLHTITALKGKPGERQITVDLPDHMTGNEYQARAMRTLCPQGNVVIERMLEDPVFWSTMLHAVIGMMGELGEIATAIQGSLWYNKGPIDKVNLKEELGDIAWYHAEGVTAVAATDKEHKPIWQDSVLVSNILKLIARYPDKFSEFLAEEENRSRAGEREILEGTITEKDYLGKMDPASAEIARKACGIDPEDAYVRDELPPKKPLDQRISADIARHVAQGRDVDLTIDGEVVQTIKASDPLGKMNQEAREYVQSQQKGKSQPGLYELHEIIAGQAAEWNLAENIPGIEVELALKTALQHMINEAQHQAGDMRSLQEDAAKAVYRNTIRLLRKDQEEKVHAPGVGHSY